MRKQRLVNLFLLLLVAGLGLLVWLTPDEENNETRLPLTTLDPATVRQISISNHNGPRFVLERDEQGWRMIEPYRVRANGPRIDILLDLLSTPRVESFPLPVDRLAEFGLDKPLAELTFDQTRITFGGTHPYNYRRYLRIDDQLYLINDIFPHHALARAEEFVSHALFADNEVINEIDTGSWRLSRRQDGWALDPAVPDIDPGQLQEKVAAWQHTWVAKVIPAPDTPVQQRVTLRLAGYEEPRVLEVMRQKQQTLMIDRALGLAYRLKGDALLDPPVSGR